MSKNNLLDLRLDEIKLKTAKGLSLAGQKLLVTVLILSFVNVALIALSVGLVLVLGHVLGNYYVGAFVVAGIFLFMTFIVYLLRKKLFVNGLVRTFVRIFFEEKAEDEIL